MQKETRPRCADDLGSRKREKSFTEGNKGEQENTVHVLGSTAAANPFPHL